VLRDRGCDNAAAIVDDERTRAAGANVDAEEQNALLYARFQVSGIRYQAD
jgi:hypothetical protein